MRPDLLPSLTQLSLLADEGVPSPPQHPVVRPLLRAVPGVEPVADESPPAEPAGDASHEADVACKPVPRPESLHPALWLGHQIGRSADDAIPTGFAVLDMQLPGGGWPRRVLTELLLPHSGVGEIRLLSPCLAALQKSGRLLMLFDPPEGLSALALAQLGLDVQQLLVVQTRTRVLPGADSLWALEQALKSGHVGAVLAWLPPRLRAERLRRLQLAAHAHEGPAFVFRETAASQRPTAAPLRLALKAAGADAVSLRVLKRRGPPLEVPLQLALPPVLSGGAKVRADSLRTSSRGDPLRVRKSAEAPGAGDLARALSADELAEALSATELARATFVDLSAD